MKINPLCIHCTANDTCFMREYEGWPRMCPCGECIVNIVCSERCSEIDEWARETHNCKTLRKIIQETV